MVVSEDELLARPGVMRALWWSRCRQCRTIIEGSQVSSTGRPNRGDLVFLRERDGHRWWLCRGCGETG